MTLQEAIKVLDHHEDIFQRYTTKSRYQARKLGIEALKRFQEGRPKCFISTVLLLPGETKE